MSHGGYESSLTVVVNGSRRFVAPRNTINASMPFFASHQEEIQVACDSETFSLLWEWGVLGSDKIETIMSSLHIIPCFIAASFLQMEPLVDLILSRIAGNLLLLSRETETDLSQLPPPLFARLASTMSIQQLERLSSATINEDGHLLRLVPKLYKTKLEGVLRNVRMSYCELCQQLFRNSDHDSLSCSSHPSSRSRHTIDPSFSLQKHLVSLRVNFKRPWRDLFFIIWGRVNVLYCHRCHQHYQASNLSTCLNGAEHLTSPPLFSSSNPTPWQEVVQIVREYRHLIAPLSSLSTLTPLPIDLIRGDTSGGGIATFSSGGVLISNDHVNDPFLIVQDNSGQQEEQEEEEDDSQRQEEQEDSRREHSQGSHRRERESLFHEAMAPAQIFSLDSQKSIDQNDLESQDRSKPRKLRMELLREDDLYRMDLLVRQILASRVPSVRITPAPPPPDRPSPVEPLSRPASLRDEVQKETRPQRSDPPTQPSLNSSKKKTPNPYLQTIDRASNKQRSGSAIRRPSTATRKVMHPSTVSAAATKQPPCLVGLQQHTKSYSWFD